MALPLGRSQESSDEPAIPLFILLTLNNIYSMVDYDLFQAGSLLGSIFTGHF